jgi:hypothetical protein
MYRQPILELIKKSQEAERNGASHDDIRQLILPDLIKPFLDSAKDFLNWIKDDREYSAFYYDVQESGICATPAEAAALILDTIVIFHLEDSEKV